MLSDIYNGLKFSFSYFSILPIKFNDNINLHKKDILGSMLFFLPLVGMVLAIFSIGIFEVFSQLSYVGATIGAISYIILYGFIHSEAIIDVIDAIFAKHGGKDPYEVIKEPTVGAIGVFYGVFAILLKVVLLVYFLLNNLFFEFLAIVIISRIALQFLVIVSKFESTFVIELKKSFTQNYFFNSLFIFGLIGYILIGIKFFIYLIIALGISLIISKILKRKLGFINGDVLGFTLEIVELILLIILIT